MSVAMIRNISAGGGVKLVDINPTKSTGAGVGRVEMFASSSWSPCYLPVCGYAKVALYCYLSSGRQMQYAWVYDDGTTSSAKSLSSLTWTDIDIPSNAICLKLLAYKSSDSNCSFNYALFTKGSP